MSDYDCLDELRDSLDDLLALLMLGVVILGMILIVGCVA